MGRKVVSVHRLKEDKTTEIASAKVNLIVATAGASGVETVVFNLATHVAHEYKVDISVVAFEDGPLVRRLKNAGIQVSVLPVKGKFDFLGFYRFAKYLHFRGGMIHSHGARALLFSSLAKIFVRQRQVTTVHQFPPNYGHYTNWINTSFEKIFLRYFCRHRIFVSRTLKNYYLRHGIDEVNSSVIYNCIDDEYYRSSFLKNMELRTTKRSNSNIEKSCVVIGCVGRLSEVKGQEYLIRAFGIILDKKQEVNIRLLFIGEGPDRQKLKRVVDSLGLSEYVEFIGVQTNLYEWYPVFDILVIPSVAESFGLVGVEAATYGLRIVSSNCPALLEVLESYKNKIYFQSTDAGDLAKKLQESIDFVRLTNFSVEKYSHIDELFTSREFSRLHFGIYSKNVNYD